MWNLWWIVIGFAVIFIAVTVFIIVNRGFEYRYTEICSVYDPEARDGWGGYVDKEVEKEEVSDLLVALFVIPIVASIIFLPICIFVPPSRNSDVERLINEREAIVSMYDDRELFDSLSVTEKVVRYNEQVADIKSRVAIYGNWSGYCNSRYQELELIIIEKE